MDLKNGGMNIQMMNYIVSLFRIFMLFRLSSSSFPNCNLEKKTFQNETPYVCSLHCEQVEDLNSYAYNFHSETCGLK